MLILLWWSPEMRNFFSILCMADHLKKDKKGAQKRVSLDIKHVLESANILHVMAYWDLAMFKFKKCTVHERKPKKIVHQPRLVRPKSPCLFDRLYVMFWAMIEAEGEVGRP